MTPHHIVLAQRVSILSQTLFVFNFEADLVSTVPTCSWTCAQHSKLVGEHNADRRWIAKHTNVSESDNRCILILNKQYGLWHSARWHANWEGNVPGIFWGEKCLGDCPGEWSCGNLFLPRRITNLYMIFMICATLVNIQTHTFTDSRTEMHRETTFHWLYEGRSINKLQNGLILLIFNIWKIPNIGCICNLILSNSYEFYYSDFSVASFVVVAVAVSPRRGTTATTRVPRLRIGERPREWSRG